MDFKKIKLDGERNQHVTKRKNNLSAWNFFKVLYRDNLWRLFGYNLAMLLFIAPAYFMYMTAVVKVSNLVVDLPTSAPFNPFAVGIWSNVTSELATQSSAIFSHYGFFMALCGLCLAFMFSGGFAVTRDAFWTGKYNAKKVTAEGFTVTTNVTKSIYMGVISAFPYALVTAGVISFGIFGIFKFYKWCVVVSKAWTIVATVLLALVLWLVATFLLIVCSVATTYKQSVKQTIADSWLLLWLNILPNLVHVLFALVPVWLYLVVAGHQLLMSVYTVLLLMFGGMYFPHVWQTYMMKTFALFHPVEDKKAKQNEPKQQQDVQ